MTVMMTAPQQPLVLVVDDDMIMRLLARETLEQAGFRVEEAADGQAAVSAFEALRPDIVLLDVMMPVLDGSRRARRCAGSKAASTFPC